MVKKSDEYVGRAKVLGSLGHQAPKVKALTD